MASKRYNDGDGNHKYVMGATRATGGAALDPDFNFQFSSPALGIAVAAATGPAGLGAGGTGGGVVVPVKRKKVTVTNTGNTAAIANVTNAQIGVLSYAIQEQSDGTGPVAVKFYEPGGSQVLDSMDWVFRNLGGVRDNAPAGQYLFVTNTNTGVSVNLNTNTSQFSVQFIYVEIPVP